jgi:ubiquinone/menaquinone biosynthesis C-methylase UbiE
MTLNIGSGTRHRQDDEIAFDINLMSCPDVCGNAEQLPFKDETFDAIKAIHVLEHVDDILAVMNECMRVLKEDGLMYIRVPQFPDVGAIADPTHKRYFVPETFGYFTRPDALPGLTRTWKSESLRGNPQEIYATLRKDKGFIS